MAARSAIVALDAGPARVSAIESAAARAGCSAPELLLAAWAALARRSSDRDEVPITLGGAEQNSMITVELTARFSTLARSFAGSSRAGFSVDAGGPIALAVKWREQHQLSLRYDPAALAESAAQRIARSWEVLLDQVLADPDRRLAFFPILADRDRDQALATLSGPPGPVNERCIHELFELAAARDPNAPALQYGEECTSYGELDARANRIAARLRALGVERESPVAMLFEHRGREIEVMLGILKAGGAFVPLDAAQPPARLARILAELGPTLVLTDQDAPAVAGAVRVDASFAAAEPYVVIPRVVPENLAYVIFTSGSTGDPKGVMVEHRQLASYVFACRAALELDACRSLASVSSFSADLGHTAIFCALAFGACLHAIPRELALDGAKLATYFERHGVDGLKIVPAHYEALTRGGGPVVRPLRRLILGGEAPRPGLFNRLHALLPECTIDNHYGPTETTVGVISHRSTPPAPDPVPLSRVFAGSRVSVRELEGLELVPEAVPGELCIAGANVSRGYWRRPDLTAEKFVPDPDAPSPGARMYRSGDRAVRRGDGSIGLRGRFDRQLKIRGHRVEPEEIERALRSLPGITHAHVSLERTEGSEPRLIAFVILQPGADPHRLHDACRALLPLPMVPAAIVPLESFPLTANGKIDAHALGRAAARGAPKQPAPPETAAQKLVADIWREVLERSDFGLDDNFFDLGGHSISMIEVHARLRASGAEVQLLEMFRHPTVRALAERITHSPAAAAPLSPAQERARARLRLGGGAGPRKD